MSLISISIVSHGQGDLVRSLLSDLMTNPTASQFEILITLNIDEKDPLADITPPFPVQVIRNSSPKGFGANHNAAFDVSSGEYFCVLNPDIRLPSDPFPTLLDAISDRSIGLVGPIVRDPSGGVEDSARHFPTLIGLARKALGGSDGRQNLSQGEGLISVDWVAGMCMFLRSADFKDIGKFDERFFLYYEDVDLCVRLWKTGRRVAVCKRSEVIHHARRSSRTSVRHMVWHLQSMARYFLKHWLRLPKGSSCP